MDVDLLAATAEDKPVLANLLRLRLRRARGRTEEPSAVAIDSQTVKARCMDDPSRGAGSPTWRFRLMTTGLHLSPNGPAIACASSTLGLDAQATVWQL